MKRRLAALLRTFCLRLFYRLPHLPLEFSTPRIQVLPLGDRSGRAPEAPLRLWPRIHYKYITYRNARSDLRTVWEPSRFRWARPEDFPEAFESWTRTNPVGIGPQWSSSLEVAIRAVNWFFLLGWAGDLVSPKTRRDVLRWLFAHGKHLASNPEPHPINHALGRALGLFVLGSYFKNLPEAQEWFRAGQEQFSQEISLAFLPDGSYAEGAPGYGAFVLEMGLVYLALARGWGLDPGGVGPAVQRGLAFMANLAWPDGSFPILGDFDDGGVLRPRESNYFRYLLYLARFIGLKVPEPKGTKHYPDGGFLIMRRPGLHLVARVDDDPAQAGGHRHSDLGSFALWMGEPIVVDPGVYLYTGPGSLREDLRSETAHNLCWLEDKPMHIRNARKPFTLEGRKKALFSGWGGDRFVLRHDLFGPVIERRFVSLKNGLAIEDEVSEQGPWRVGFTLGPEVVPEPADRGFVLVGKSGRYGMFLEAGDGSWSKEDAVFCPRYGERQETRRLVFRPETRNWRVAFVAGEDS